MAVCKQCLGTGRTPCEGCNGRIVVMLSTGPYRQPCVGCDGRPCPSCQPVEVVSVV